MLLATKKSKDDDLVLFSSSDLEESNGKLTFKIKYSKSLKEVTVDKMKVLFSDFGS